jgi:hypothetical protein
MLVAPEHQGAGDAVVDYGLSDSRHAEAAPYSNKPPNCF